MSGVKFAWVECAYCNGTGKYFLFGTKCSVCGGAGRVRVGEPHRQCSFCKGTGVHPGSDPLTCTACGGKGEVPAPGEPSMSCPACCGSAQANTQATLDCLYCKPHSGVISVVSFLLRNTQISLSDYSVVGGFVCYDHRLRIKLIIDVNDLRVCLNVGGKPICALLCAGPGSGKTFLAKQVAANCGAEFVEDNLSASADLRRDLNRHMIKIYEKLSTHSKVLAFSDEVDTVVGGETSYRFLTKAMLGDDIDIDGREIRLTNLLWVFAISKATSRSGFEKVLTEKQYEKGDDFLDRCGFTITLPGVDSPGERVVKAVAMAKAECPDLERIEGSAVFYYACKEFRSVREMKHDVRIAINSLTPGNKILRLGNVVTGKDSLDFHVRYNTELQRLANHLLRIS